MTYDAANRFPERVKFGVTGGPEYSTLAVRTRGGDEYREQLLEQALHSWDVSHVVKRPAAWRLIRAHFHAAGGRDNTFPFKDWSDFTVAAGEGFFTQLTSTTFQMVKHYVGGGTTRIRRIQKPRNNGTVIVTGGVGATVDYVTGIVTVASGTPTAWVGDFDVPCRYDTDKLEGEIVNKKTSNEFLIAWNAIPILEIPIG